MTKLPADLPVVLRVVAKAGGLGAAKSFAQAFGGRRISIPKSAKRKHPIFNAAGKDGAAALVQAYGGERIDVPLWRYSGVKQFLAGQRRAIIERSAQGDSGASIARSLGCTERAVRKIRARVRDEGQDDLFG